MTANPPPAGMPSEEEIAKLLMKQFYDQWFAPHRPAYQGSVYWDFVNGSSAWGPSARAVLDLFAPILAEKEREALEAHADFGKLTVIAETWQSRALAAEAALAGERERCAKIAGGVAKIYCSGGLEWLDGVADARHDIAAAIRGRDEP